VSVEALNPILRIDKKIALVEKRLALVRVKVGRIVCQADYSVVKGLCLRSLLAQR
jgi:hypothetical protein